MLGVAEHVKIAKMRLVIIKRKMSRLFVISSFCCFLTIFGSSHSVSSRGDAALKSANCVGRCGQGSNQTSCACDSRCKVYEDCCIDFDVECPNESAITSDGFNRTKQNGVFNTYKSCLPLIANGSVSAYFPAKYMMVSSCPNTWDNEFVTERCMTNKTSEILNVLPVHDENGVLFKNSYCAFCHGISVDEMLLWVIAMNEGSYHPLPPRNIWGSKYQICDKNFFFYKTCPSEANFTLVEKCETSMEPTLYDVRYGYKNDDCRVCNNHSLPALTLIESVVTYRSLTFDVMFGVQSWSVLTSNCRNNRRVNVKGIFQNACPLLDDLREMENSNSAVTSTSVLIHPTDCVSHFLSEMFQTSQKFYSVRQKSVPDDDKTFANIYLPNELSALYLQNTIKNNITTPECNVTLGIFLNAERVNVTGCSTGDDRTMLDFDNESFHIFDIECSPSKCIVTHQKRISCSEVMSCHWESEELPPIDFKIEDFVTMEITHINTGASLSELEYTISTMGKIQTCTEFLIGPWINAAYYIQIVCGSLSLICILFVIAIHLRFPKLRNLYGFCMVSLLSILWVALFLLSISTLTQMVDGLAQVVSFLGHYAWLSAFAWMTVISFHVSHTFSGKFVANKMNKISSRKESILFSLFGWGIPLPFVITAVILHLCHCTDFHYTRHWMSRSIATFVVFAVPAGLLALTTTFLFVVGMTKLRQRQARPSESGNKHTAMIHNYLVAVRLFFIVGVPWTLLIVYMAYRNRVLLPVLTLINSLQGFFIFLSFVSTKRVRSLMRDRFDQSRQNATTYSRAKTTAQTDTGTPENTPKTKRQKLSATSASGDEIKHQTE